MSGGVWSDDIVVRAEETGMARFTIQCGVSRRTRVACGSACDLCARMLQGLGARTWPRRSVPGFDRWSCRGGIIAVLAIALALTGGEGIAVASTMHVYGGGTNVMAEAPVAFEWRIGGDDSIEPFGRITLMAIASCPDPIDGFSLSLDAAIVPTTSIPSGNVLFGTRKSGGRFTAEGSRSITVTSATGLVTERVNGRIQGQRVSGTYRAKVQLTDAAGAPVGTCSTDAIPWSARSSPRRIFAGRTSEDQPVVVTLDLLHHRVEQLLLGTRLNCDQIGMLDGVSVFSGSLRNGGRFTDSDRYEIGPDHGRDKVTATIQGIRGHGTFRDRRRISTPDGDRDCDTGRVTWSVRSSREAR
jgi:hypothetical protein